MKVGAQPFARPLMPSSLTVTANPLPMLLYLSGFTLGGKEKCEDTCQHITSICDILGDDYKLVLSSQYMTWTILFQKNG